MIRVDDLAGKTIATVLSTACHPIVLGPSCAGYHPDFVGPARRLVETSSGAPCLFLQGAGGNIMPDVGMGAGPEQVCTLQKFSLGYQILLHLLNDVLFVVLHYSGMTLSGSGRRWEVRASGYGRQSGPTTSVAPQSGCKVLPL